jgi:hypothetical protein
MAPGEAGQGAPTEDARDGPGRRPEKKNKTQNLAFFYLIQVCLRFFYLPIAGGFSPKNGTVFFSHDKTQKIPVCKNMQKKDNKLPGVSGTL